MADYTLEGERWAGKAITASFAKLVYKRAQTYPYTTVIPTLYRPTIHNALAAWAKAAGLTITWLVDDGATADIRVGFAKLNTPGGGPVGHTDYHYSGGLFLAPTEVQIEDPGEDGLIPDGTGDFTYSGWTSKLSQVVGHEFGHALGLGHSPAFGCMMYPSVGTHNPVLGAGDIAGIQAIYGLPG